MRFFHLQADPKFSYVPKISCDPTKAKSVWIDSGVRSVARDELY